MNPIIRMANPPRSNAGSAGQARPFCAILLVCLLLFHNASGILYSQSTAPVPTSQQLDQLLAPVALYPDTLLAQITTASTNPQEILDVDNWLQQNMNLTGADLQNAAQQQGFDPAFVALVTFPDVLNMMAQNVDDYAAIGAAFSANQALVMDSVQRLRAQAYAAGNLQSNQQQQVVTQNQGGQQIIVVQPANPQVVYLPTYDPTVIYTRPSTGTVVAGALLTFGAGIAIGALINNQPWGWGGWGWNWGHRTVIVNHNTWVFHNNYYRPPHYTYRPRPVPYNYRPGYGGNWGYRPPNYRPPYASRPPSYRPPPGGRPNYRPPSNPPPNYRPPLIRGRRQIHLRRAPRLTIVHQMETEIARRTKIVPLRQLVPLRLLGRPSRPRMPMPVISRTKVEQDVAARSAETTAVAKLKRQATADSKA